MESSTPNKLSSGVVKFFGRPFREEGMILKALQCYGLAVVLKWCATKMDYFQDGLIGKNVALAATMAIMFCASAVSERNYRGKWEWRSSLSVVGAIVSFYYIFSAGDQLAMIESSTPGTQPLSMALAGVHFTLSLFLWLIWDGIIAPRQVPIQPK